MVERESGRRASLNDTRLRIRTHPAYRIQASYQRWNERRGVGASRTRRHVAAMTQRPCAGAAEKKRCGKAAPRRVCVGRRGRYRGTWSRGHSTTVLAHSTECRWRTRGVAPDEQDPRKKKNKERDLHKYAAKEAEGTHTYTPQKRKNGETKQWTETLMESSSQLRCTTDPLSSRFPSASPLHDRPSLLTESSSAAYRMGLLRGAHAFPTQTQRRAAADTGGMEKGGGRAREAEHVHAGAWKRKRRLCCSCLF